MKFGIRFNLLLVLLVAVLLLGGCRREFSENGDKHHEKGFSGDEESDPYGTVQSRDDDNDLVPGDNPSDQCTSGKRFTYILSQQGHTIPYPSDLFTWNDPSSPTGRRVFIGKDDTLDYLEDQLSLYRFVVPAVNRLDGFGVSTPIWFPATAAPNLSLAQQGGESGTGDGLVCVVLEEEDHPYFGERWPVETTWIRDRGLMAVRPRLPFFQNTTYACIVTDAMRTAQDECYELSDHFAYLVQTKPDWSHPQAESLEPVRRQLAPFFDQLENQYGLLRENILVATFFTTQWVTHDLMSVREQLEEMAAADPPLPGDWTQVAGAGATLDSVWETAYPTVNWRKKGVFVADEQGDPVPQGEETVTLRLSLPQKDLSGYPQPYPVIIYGHGINSSRYESSSFAHHIAPYGFAVVGIDWEWHGARSKWLENMDPTIAIVFRDLLFFDFLHPRKMRDNMKQGIADIIWLKHLIRQLGELDLLPYETGGDGIPDLDVDTIYYVGMSLGSIHGGIAAAVEPAIPTWLLNVGGAEFRAVAFEGAAGDIIFDLLDLLRSQLSLDLESDVRILGDLIFSVSDAGDPYAYGPYVFKQPLWAREEPPRNLFLQMAAYDTTMGGTPGGQMAKSMGLTHVRPAVWPIDFVGETDAPFEGPGVYQFDTDNHGMLFWGEFAEESRLQAGIFLRTAMDNSTATIIDPLAEQE